MSNASEQPPAAPSEGQQRWERRLQRERRARELAEQALENRSRELWVASRSLATERGLLVAAMWTNGLQVWEWDADDDSVVMATPDPSRASVLRTRRRSRSELVATLEPADRKRFTAGWDALVEGDTQLDVSVRIRSASGLRWIKIVGRALRGEGEDDASARRIVGTLRDVSEELSTSSAHAIHQQVLSGRGHPWFTCDGSGRVLACIQPAADLLQAAEGGDRGDPHLGLLIDWGRVVDLLAGGNAPGAADAEWIDLGDPARRYGLRCRTFLDPARLEPRILVELDPVSQAGEVDPATGLPNRRAVRSWLSDGGIGEPMRGAVLVGLARFARINEHHGAAFGDLVLEAVGKRLASWLREDDRIARWDGDQFLILTPIQRDPERLRRFARTLLEALEVPLQIGSREVVVGARAAASGLGSDATGADLVRQAEVAYKSGRRANTLVSLFDARMAAGNDREEEVGAALRRALELGHLRAWFQPKIKNDGSIGGWEALCRWPEGAPDGTHPGEFIPIAERLGLDSALTAAMVEQSVAFAANLQAAGRLEPVSVNLPAGLVLDPELPTRLAGACARAGLPTRLLALELTESSLVEDQGRARTVLEALQHQGHRIMLDDFGTGFSALSYLRSLPFDVVKIDRSFLSDVENDAKAAGLLGGTIQLVRSLGMRVVVEGVERVDQWQLLRRHGVDLVQGFLFTPALPLIDAIAWQPSVHTDDTVTDPPGWRGADGTADRDAGQGERVA